MPALLAGREQGCRDAPIGLGVIGDMGRGQGQQPHAVGKAAQDRPVFCRGKTIQFLGKKCAGGIVFSYEPGLQRHFRCNLIDLGGKPFLGEA